MRKEEKQFERFVQLVGRVEPVEFLGLAKLFGADLNDSFDFSLVLEQIMDKFLRLRPKRKKEIIKMLEQLGGDK